MDELERSEVDTSTGAITPIALAIKPVDLAKRWKCTKAYISKLKRTHKLDPSSFASWDQADEWLKRNAPKLHEAYSAPPAAATAAAATPPATPPAGAPPSPPAPPLPASKPVVLPIAPRPAVAVVAGEDDFFDVQIARARVATELAFEAYLREDAAGSAPKLVRETLATYADASAAYTRLKKMQVDLLANSNSLVQMEAVKSTLLGLITTWNTLLDRLETRVACSPDIKARIRKAVGEMKEELAGSVDKLSEELTGAKKPDDEDADE